MNHQLWLTFEDALTFIHTNASGKGLGAALLQRDSAGVEHPIIYASRQLSEPESLCQSLELECLAVVRAVEKFLPCIYGKHFTVVPYNSALR